MRYFLLLEAAALLASLDFIRSSPCHPVSSTVVSIDAETTSNFSLSFVDTLSTEISTVSSDTEIEIIIQSSPATTEATSATSIVAPVDELITVTTGFATATELMETTSVASVSVIDSTAEVSTTDAVVSATTDFNTFTEFTQITSEQDLSATTTDYTTSQVTSSTEPTYTVESTATTSPTEAPTYTNLVKNGDFRLPPQQGEYLYGFETNTGRFTETDGYTGSGSDETHGGTIQAVLLDVRNPHKGVIKQNINITKKGQIAARLSCKIISSPFPSYCVLSMTLSGNEVASVTFARQYGRWIVLGGEVDMEAGEAEFAVSFHCIGEPGNGFAGVDQIVVSDEASLEDLDHVKFVY